MTWLRLYLPDWPVLAALAVLGATSGALGCFAVLRRQSLLGDTLAHAALPGVCLAYWLTGSKDPLVLLLGALGTGVLGTLWVLGLAHGSRLKQDTTLGIVLSSFFAFGIVLLTLLQQRGDGNQSGLNHFIFGQAAFLTQEHVLIMAALGVVALGVLALLYKEFKLLSFDPAYAMTLGYPARGLEIVLSILLVIAVLISLRAVGVVLTVALLIAPAAAARQWTHRLRIMIGLAMFFGIISGWAGAVWSQAAANAPTGPAVVLVASGILAVSLLFAPQQGLVWSWLRLQRHRQTVRRENLLADFFRLAERDRQWLQGRTLAELAAVRQQPPGPLLRPLQELRDRGDAVPEQGSWRLTPAGLDAAAAIVRKHRLWEVYLARRLELATDHVHRDAEEMEHALPQEIIAELEANLDNPELDPHGHPIPRVPARTGP